MSMRTKEMVALLGIDKVMEIIMLKPADVVSLGKRTQTRSKKAMQKIREIVAERKGKVDKVRNLQLTKIKDNAQKTKKECDAITETLERRKTLHDYLQKASDAYKTALADYENIRVHISKRNDKMGEVVSTSMPTGITCYGENGTLPACALYCYARYHIDGRIPDRLKENAQNLAIYKKDKGRYWEEVRNAIRNCMRFRFNVSGDIPDSDYWENVVKSAIMNTHCTILIFTKKYHIVNTWIANHGELPTNLKVMFSVDPFLPMNNPHRLPIADIYEGDCPTAWTPCNGHCENCFRNNTGCIGAKRGEIIGLPKH